MSRMVHDVIDRIERYGTDETFEVVGVEQIYSDKYIFTIVRHVVEEEKNEDVRGS